MNPSVHQLVAVPIAREQLEPDLFYPRYLEVKHAQQPFRRLGDLLLEFVARLLTDIGEISVNQEGIFCWQPVPSPTMVAAHQGSKAKEKMCEIVYRLDACLCSPCGAAARNTLANQRGNFDLPACAVCRPRCG